jgi:acyl-homoserine-lactone acylase
VDSIATSVAVYWGEEIGGKGDHASDDQRLQALSVASDKLESDYGTWQTAWGTINRFQRVNGDIVQPFSDAAPSIPVGFTSSRWGSLASFGARTYNGTKKMYGNTGNSFVAIVEFGDRVRAKAVTAGGESGNPASAHFNDQAVRYGTGDLRDVYFTRSDLEGHIERQYHPGN